MVGDFVRKSTTLVALCRRHEAADPKAHRDCAVIGATLDTGFSGMHDEEHRPRSHKKITTADFRCSSIVAGALLDLECDRRYGGDRTTARRWSRDAPFGTPRTAARARDLRSRRPTLDIRRRR